MKKDHILDFIIILIIGLHLFYSIFMFTQGLLYGAIWLTIFLIEALIYFIGLKKIKFFKYFLVFILLLQFIASGVIMITGTKIKNDNKQVLVLGYALDNDQMTETLKMRLDKAYAYANEHKDSTLILCGGITGNNSVSEAKVMEDYLLDKGFDSSRIILEDKSTDTIENIVNASNYLEDNKVLVISSNYHVFRARMICNKAGLEADGLGSKAPLLLIPNQLLFEKIGIFGLMINK